MNKVVVLEVDYLDIYLNAKTESIRDKEHRI